MLNIVIVDDETPAQQRLKQLLADLTPIIPTQVIACYSSGVEYLNDIQSNPQSMGDVCLFDIQMPTIDGLTLAKKVKEICVTKQISIPFFAFVTAYENFAVAAFELEASDYLLKPIKIARLQHTLERALAKNKLIESITPDTNAHNQGTFPAQQRQTLTIHDRGQIIFLPIHEIVYFRAEMKYITVVTASRTYLIDESLNTLAQEFSEKFVRIHRSILIAKSSIGALSRNQHDQNGEANYWVEVIGKTEKLPVSRRQWPELKKTLLFQKIIDQ